MSANIVKSSFFCSNPSCWWFKYVQIHHLLLMSFFPRENFSFRSSKIGFLVRLYKSLSLLIEPQHFWWVNLHLCVCVSVKSPFFMIYCKWLDILNSCLFSHFLGLEWFHTVIWWRTHDNFAVTVTIHIKLLNTNLLVNSPYFRWCHAPPDRF